MVTLTSTTTSKPRYISLECGLNELRADFTDGLDATTRAIWHAESEFCEPETLLQLINKHTGNDDNIDNLSITQKNRSLAFLIRDVTNQHVEVGNQVYKTLCKANKNKHYPSLNDVNFTVVSSPTSGRIDEVGPKGIGGHSWKTDTAFKEATKSWMVPGDLQMGPCILFGWMGIAKKVAIFDDPKTAVDFWTSQLLGVVDYGFDKDEKIMPGGIRHAIERTAKMVVKNKDRMRGVGLVGLLMVDQQLSYRQMQYAWATEGTGSYVTGPTEISPQDFARAGYTDCAALVPLAYQTAAELEPNGKAIFVATLFCSLHDLIYDMGSSNRISCASYCDAAGTFQTDLPQAFVVGTIDAMATKLLHGTVDREPLFGENAVFVACVWNIFNVRYRSWERLVKYTRLLARSKEAGAVTIIDRATKGLILVPEDPNADTGDGFEEALDPSNSSKLVSRSALTNIYALRNPKETLIRHGLTVPELCEQCLGPFQEAFFHENDTIQAIPALPQNVIDSDPVIISAAIRRGALWATSSVCCDSCACTIGFWTNSMSDRAVVALMQDEQRMSVRDWLLQNYAMGCVAFSPLRVISILTGFDVAVDIQFAEGVLSENDVDADC
ncbi:hypothetical protein EG329_013914 [Mollisiaceae sp. DMI_Dod_QoI]|nr:hypothetical protein EG329_013914 [Helotiales sp. DMI_Dod_QoI]